MSKVCKYHESIKCRNDGECDGCKVAPHGNALDPVGGRRTMKTETTQARPPEYGGATGSIFGVPLDKVLIVGNKVYTVCPRCGKTVQLNKPLVGSMHVCA